MTKRTAEQYPGDDFADERRVSRGRRPKWDDDSSVGDLSNVITDEELAEQFASFMSPAAPEQEIPVPDGEQESLDSDPFTPEANDGETALSDSPTPEPILRQSPAYSQAAFRHVRGRKAAAARKAAQSSVSLAVLDERESLPDDEPLEGVIVDHPQDNTSDMGSGFGTSSEPDVIIGTVVESHDHPLTAAMEGTSREGAEEPKESPKHSAADVQAGIDAKRLQAENDAAAAAVATTPPVVPVFAKPADAYDVAYDDTVYMGPTKQHMPTRDQSTQMREFMQSDAYKAAHDTYNTVDNELAVKVARRLKLGMFTTKKTRETSSAEVEATHAAYERMSEVFDAMQIEKYKLAHPDISEEELNAKMARYHEAKLRLQGLRAQSEILTSKGRFGKVSEWNNKLTEKFASLTLPGKIGVAAASLAVGAVVGAAGVAIGGAAGATGAVLLAGAKVYKTSAQGRAGLLRNTATIDKADFKNSDGSYKSTDELRTQSQATFQKGFEARVKKADHVNKVAKWTTIGSAAMLGAGVANHIGIVHDVYKAVEDHVGGWLDGLQHHDAHSGVSHDVTPSQGGGSAHNPIDKLGSGDVYTPPKIDVVPMPSHDAFVPTDIGGGTEFSGQGLGHFNEWANGHTVQPGESVWKLAHDYLQANGVKDPSTFQIDAVKDKVLAEFSAKGLVDGNGWLSAGEQLRLR